jgi:hypothetical protein
MKIIPIFVLVLFFTVGCAQLPETGRESQISLINVKSKVIREESGNTLYIIKASTETMNEVAGKQCVIEGSVNEFISVKSVYDSVKVGMKCNVVIEGTTGAIIQIVSGY